MQQYCKFDVMSPNLSESYFPNSMKDIGAVWRAAKLHLEAMCIKSLDWRGQIEPEIEDGLRLCLWCNSIFHRFLWALLSSALQWEHQAITEDRACWLLSTSNSFLYSFPVSDGNAVVKKP